MDDHNPACPSWRHLDSSGLAPLVEAFSSFGAGLMLARRRYYRSGVAHTLLYILNSINVGTAFGPPSLLLFVACQIGNAMSECQVYRCS